MRKLIVGLCCALLISCGGGGGNTTPAPDNGPKASTKIEYTDPVTSSSKWRLAKASGTSETTAVLNLIGPSNLKVTGLVFTVDKSDNFAFQLYTHTNSSDQVGGTSGGGTVFNVGKFSTVSTPFNVDVVFTISLSVAPSYPATLKLNLSKVKYIDENRVEHEDTIDVGVLKVIP